MMFAAVTLQGSVTLSLKGTADVTARTTIGNVPIAGVPFDVSSSLKGAPCLFLRKVVVIQIFPNRYQWPRGHRFLEQRLRDR